MQGEMQKQIKTLEQKVTDMERKLAEMETKDKIEVVGAFDGTNIPVNVNGIRRKIATAAA